MADHPYKALVAKGYRAFAAGDMDTLRGLFADDIVWHTGGRSDLSGDYKGHDEVFGLFGRFIGMTDGTMKVEPHAILADDTHAVALVRASAHRNGRHFEADEVHVFHVSDGRVTEFWSMSSDPYAADEFWAD